MSREENKIKESEAERALMMLPVEEQAYAPIYPYLLQILLPRVCSQSVGSARRSRHEPEGDRDDGLPSRP